MDRITTEAWVLHQGPEHREMAELKREQFSFPNITEHEVLAEPLYGCWEGNMNHAVERQPIDICRQRGEEKVVIGNAGVVRILKTGSAVTTVKEGDVCYIFGNAVPDRFGFLKKAYAYDARHTIGLLAKQMKVNERMVIPIPDDPRYTPQQWAAFAFRYLTAWSNWKAAYGCFRAVLSEDELPDPFVWGWGGGVSLAELELAQFFNCRVAMISSNSKRLEIIRSRGIKPIDRRQFINLNFDEKRFQTDSEFKKAYQEAESDFLAIVKEHTNGLGASIFLDYIGSPVTRATLKALGCPGVITTAGWKGGMKIANIRAIECMNWHIHVHTHGARYAEALEATSFAVENGWLPDLDGTLYGWDDIPQLARDFSAEKITTYFPLYQVNPL